MASEHATQTLASRGDLSARARLLLEEQLAEFGARIEPSLRAVLSELEQQLFQLAEQARNNADQQVALEGMRDVKRNRADAVPQLLLSLERRVATLGQPATETDLARIDLALVDQDEFDEAIALDDIATRAELRASTPLFELGHRYAVLAAAPLIEAEALPVGPHALAQALRDAALGMGLSREHRILFYRLCDRRVFAAAEALYNGLNEHLAERGILPNLRVYLPRRKLESDPHRKPHEKTAEAGTPPTAAATALPTAPPRRATPAAELDSLRAMLGARRDALGLEMAEAATAGGRTASIEELQAALGRLQGRAPGPIQLGGRGVPRTVQHLRQDALAEMRQHSGDGLPPQLAAEQRDVFDLVSLLFDRLLDETRSGGSAQQLLARMQVPLLRVALADRNFFTRRTHPARRLLNSVAETANLWLDHSDGEPDRALSDRLQRTVDRALAEFTGDVALFERLSDELDSHVHALKRRAEIAERRQVEAAQGRDRLEQARASAAAAIAERLAGRKVSPLTRALLEQAWTDALALAILRHGESSEAFHRRLAAADELLREPPQRDNERLRVEIEDGLVQVGLHAAEATQLAQRVLDLPVQEPAHGEAPSQTELAVKLKTRQRLGETDVARPAEKPAPVPPPLNAEEQRALTRLKSMPFGTWFEFIVNQQGHRVARKLAWYTPQTGHCLLVSVRGVPGPERTLVQLARLMVLGQAQLLAPEGESLIDRAWNAFVSSLRQFTGGGRRQETGT